MNEQTKAILRLIRPMNLFIMLLLFIIVRYCITDIFLDEQLYLSDLAFGTIIISTLAIAAGGYVINDYFDREIDLINKPSRVVVGKKLSLQETVQIHLILSLFGILFGASVAFVYEIYSLFFIQLFSVFALFFYAVSLKKRGLPGNITVAILTALVPMVAGMYEFLNPYMEIPLSILGAYAGFAFLFTLIRELIKDLEDMAGDRQYGCRTFPIRYGMKKTKIFIAVLLVFAIGGIGIAQNFSKQIGDLTTIYYFLATVQVPSLILMIMVLRTNHAGGFRKASHFIKVIMLFGILYGVVLYYLN